MRMLPNSRWRLLRIGILTGCLLLFSVQLCAAAPPRVRLTSPWGVRIHPVTHKEHFHDGIDLAFPVGTPMPAVMGGKVIRVVERYIPQKGYGKYVQILHDDGSSTLYAHLDSIAVTEGQRVAEGAIIGRSGNTGRSTGPHLHLTYRKPGGIRADPLPLVLAHGWSIDPLPDVNGGEAVTDWGATDSEEAQPLDIKALVDIAAQVREMLETFSRHCVEGIRFLKDDLQYLMYCLMAIDLALGALFAVLLKEDGEDWAQFLVKRTLLYGFVLYVFLYWPEHVNTWLDSATQIGAIASGNAPDLISRNLSDPTLIIEKGIYLAQPALSYSRNPNIITAILTFGLPYFLSAIVGLAIMFCALLIGLQFFLTYLEFYVITTLAVVTWPFAALRQTKFLAHKSIGAVLNIGLKLMIMSLLVAVLVPAMQNLLPAEYSLMSGLKTLCGMIAALLLLARIPKTIGRILQIDVKW